MKAKSLPLRGAQSGVPRSPAPMVRAAPRQHLRSTRSPQLLLALTGLFFCPENGKPIFAVRHCDNVSLLFSFFLYLYILFQLYTRMKRVVVQVLKLALSLCKTLPTYLRNFTTKNFLCVAMHNPCFSKFPTQFYLYILLLTLSRASYDCSTSGV